MNTLIASIIYYSDHAVLLQKIFKVLHEACSHLNICTHMYVCIYTQHICVYKRTKDIYSAISCIHRDVLYIYTDFFSVKMRKTFYHMKVRKII